MATGKSITQAEFGDFQTPPELARAVVDRLRRGGLAPRSVPEPPCGQGNLLFEALHQLDTVERAVGIDRNEAYIADARGSLARHPQCELHRADVFDVDWPDVIASLPEPLLVLGNPPWITSAELGRIGSANRPPRLNPEGRLGFEAVTGRSNFDLSEWLLQRALNWTQGRDATVAMLCKTQVARRALEAAWRHDTALATGDLFRINASRHFGASVDACLLVVSSTEDRATHQCRVHADLEVSASSTFGLRSDRLVADVEAHGRWAHLAGTSPEPYRWRSGIKHDCAAVMELRESDRGLLNGADELVEIESELLFPLRKSAELGSRAPRGDPRWLIVPQRTTGDDTASLATRAPRAWQYLCRHAARLDARRSTIYRGRPRFAVFGIGHYSFAPWKLAISGLYKRLSFRVVGPRAGRPTVLDDTCYALPCRDEIEARFLLELVESEPAREFLGARVFWDAKRPITIGLLSQLDLSRLAAELGRTNTLQRYLDEPVERRGAAGM